MTAARELAVAAAQPPDPVIKAGVDNLSVSGRDRFNPSADSMTMRRIGITQELTRSDKLALRAQRYEHEAEKALAEREQLLANIERQAALAWFDVHFAGRTFDLITAQQTQVQQELVAADAAYRAGRGSLAELLGVRESVAQLQDRLLEAQRKLRSTTIQLARWIGDDAERPLAPPPPTDKSRFIAGDLEPQLAHHPAMEVFQQQQALAQSEVLLARANQRPDWTVDVTFQQRGSAFTNMLSVGISAPFQLDRGRRQDRELSAKIALASQAKDERAEQLREHVAQAKMMLENWQGNRRRLRHYADQVVPDSQQRTQAVLAAFRGGKTSLTEVLAVRRAELDVALQGLQLEADTARSWAEVNYMIPSTHTLAPANKEVP